MSWAMAERLVNVDRETPMLLPVDLRDWVAEDDLVHFVIESVETMKLLKMGLKMGVVSVDGGSTRIGFVR